MTPSAWYACINVGTSLDQACGADIGHLVGSPSFVSTRHIAHWHTEAVWAVESSIDRLPGSLGRNVIVNSLNEPRNWPRILTLPVDHMQLEGMLWATPGVAYRIDARGTLYG